MKEVTNYGDVRNERACCHCGDLFLRTGRSMDHIPPKVLLDDPLPANLHKAYCCKECNSGLSHDELYLACLIECVLAGSTALEKLGREKIRRSLERNRELRASLEHSRHSTADGTLFIPDVERVERAALKLVRAHASYELNEPKPESLSHLLIKPLSLMTNAERDAFEQQPEAVGWPEVGSRKMVMIAEGSEDVIDGWTIVQEGRYRYMTSTLPITVRCVLSEYLAIEAVWEDLH